MRRERRSSILFAPLRISLFRKVMGLADLLKLILIAVALGCDAFSVAFGIGSGGARSPRQTFRISFHFGLFQAIMPLLGWLLGAGIAAWIQKWDHWVAFLLLLGVGLHMLWEASHKKKEEAATDRSRGLTLVILSVAVSIDAMAVGLVLGLRHVTPWWPCVLIGVMTSLMSLTGIHLGRRMKAWFGRGAEIFGGCVLVILAFSFLKV